MKPITELERIDPRLVATLGEDQEGMAHSAKLTVQDPAVFLTLMGIIKATNINDGNSSPAGDIGVSFAIGFLTAWHICQGAEFEALARQLEADAGILKKQKAPPVVICTICGGEGIGGDGTTCEHCNGMGHVALPEHGTLGEILDKIDGIAICDFCRGLGYTDDSGKTKCPQCAGDGKL